MSPPRQQRLPPSLLAGPRSSPPRWRRIAGWAAGGTVLFALAFGWAACRSFDLHSYRHVPIPDLPALIRSSRVDRPVPIPDFILHEGQWEWPHGGAFFVLPDAARGLPTESLTASREAVQAANAEGADPPWRLKASDAPAVASGYALAASAAWAADWWRIQMGHRLVWRVGRLSARREMGLSPWAVAALYASQAARDPQAFPLSGPGRLDPVTARPYPCSLDAMARLFAIAAQAQPTSDTLVRIPWAGWPSGGETLRFEEFAAAGAPLRITPSRPIASPAEAEAAADALARALRDYGVILAGLTEGAWQPAEGGDWRVSRAAILVGCYEKDGRRLFLLRSPLGFVNGRKGLPTALALAPAEALAGAWAFPHPFRAEWTRTPGPSTRLRVSDAEGKPLAIRLPEEIHLQFDGELTVRSRGDYRIRPAPRQVDGPLSLTLSPAFFLPPSGPRTLSLPARTR